MRRGLLLLAAFALVLGCRETEPEKLLEARVVSTQNDLVGGPLAHGQIGDFLIQNDQVRFVITGAHHSWGPGLFGGTVVDADLRRNEPWFRGAEGNDQFAELFPSLNILVADPTDTQITVEKDGSDGEEAVIRARGTGLMFLEALEILDPTGPADFAPLLASLDVKTVFDFDTRFILRPGDRFLEITTTVTRPAFLFESEACGTLACDKDCPLLRDPSTNCLVCECDEGKEMDLFTESVPLLAKILGSTLSADAGEGRKAGMIGADFLFFGGGTDVFAPGLGFDEKGQIFANLLRGVDTITRPLTFDWLASVGDDVSYGVFSKRKPGATCPSEPDGVCKDPKILIPLFTSSATLIGTAGLACLADTADDADCDAHTSFRWTRYLAVGDGDVNSVARIIWSEQGAAMGRVRGTVLDSRFGHALARADVFALRDPDPDADFTTYEEIVAQNLADTTRVGVVNQSLADVGTRATRNGSFSMDLPVGSWFLVARSKDGVLGRPVRVTVEAGRDDTVNLVSDPPAWLDYRILDEQGRLVPAKITLQALDPDGNVLYADGKKPVALGESRFDDGIFDLIYSEKGHGRHATEAGHYRVTASRGFEYSIHTEDVELASGSVTTFSAHIRREVDTSGWISGDFHLHAESSMDSGMDLGLRVVTGVTEGVELLSSSDHDNVTDYLPTLLKHGLQRFATTQIGTELTTLELGHYLGFPLKYDHTAEPVHGAVDWVCKTVQEFFDEMRALGEFGPESTVTVVAHPRDGFFGYFDQFDLDPWTADRGPDLGLQSNNPLLKTLSCDFDAIEMLNGKRFELIRTPTVAEVVDAERCLAEINAAISNDDVRAACAWLREPPTCDASDRLRGEPCSWYEEAAAGFETCADEDLSALCKDKARNAVTLLSVRRMIYRTPEEQDAWIGATEEQRDGDKTECSPDLSADLPIGDALEDERAVAPCAQHEGTVDDWFALLNHGMNVAAMGNSDSHGTTLEPGIPRTWIASSTDDASRIDRREVNANLKAQKAIASTGPFVTIAIGDAQIGETAVVEGAEIPLHVKVQTPSWFGISRIEIYRNGQLEKGIDVNEDPAVIVDYDQVVTLDAPDTDSWYAVSTVGLRTGDFLAPVYHTVPLGELTFGKITALAFDNLGVIGALFGSSSQVPDFFPSLPYAITNPIKVDVDGDGYQAPMGAIPGFCPTACETAEDCPREGDVCHPNASVNLAGDGGTCGPEIEGECGVRLAEERAALSVEKPAARRARDPAKLRGLQHALGRHLWNGFVHPTHLH